MLSSVRRLAALLMSMVAVFSVALTAIGTSGASAETGASPGVTSNSVTLGLFADLSGPLANPFAGSVQGAEAAIDEQNAQGGVDGRKIKLVIGDDQSNPTNALTVAQSLVQQKNAFALLDVSAFFALVYKYLEQAGIPGLTGEAFDGGPEWSNPSTSDLIDGSGATNLQNTGWQWMVKLLKQEKITKLAVVAYGSAAASVANANQIAAAAQQAGIQVVDKDVSVSETQTDLTPNALKLKNSGANGWISSIAGASQLAMLTALRQQDVHAKGFLAGYEADLLQPPTNKIDQGSVVFSGFKTPELGDDQVIAAMRKYLGYKGPVVPPNATGVYFGWAAATLAIQGLKVAGKNLTTTSFLNGLHGLKTYTADGLEPDVNLAQSKQGTYAAGTTGNCSYALEVVDTKFVPTSTSAYCTP
jgi:branched-chain amino acid transport system substrate-binding protein